MYQNNEIKTLKISGVTGDSTILVNEKLQNLKKYIPNQKLVIITDTHVGKIYGKDFPP